MGIHYIDYFIYSAFVLLIHTYYEHFTVGDDIIQTILKFYEGIPVRLLQPEERSCDS